MFTYRSIAALFVEDHATNMQAVFRNINLLDAIADSDIVTFSNVTLLEIYA